MMKKRFSSLVVVLALVWFCFPGLASGADKAVIVGFHKAPGPYEQALIHGAKGIIKRKFKSIRAISAKVPEHALEDLRKNPNVAFVEEDGLAQAIVPVEGVAQVDGTAEYDTSWSVSHIGVQTVHEQNVTGAGIKIAVLDTGIDYTHPDLDGNYVGGDNFVSLDPTFHDPYDDSFNSHGTHVAGIIGAELDGAGVVGVAPQASLYAVKVLDGAGFGPVSAIIAGIEWAIANQMDIANLSLGIVDYYQSLDDACTAANNAGLLLVAAAGNTYGGPVLYPAAYPSVVAVGATTIYDDIAPISAIGPEVELAAPGLNIYSTIANNSYNYLGGTSQAAPHVAGIAALVMTAGIGDVDGDGDFDNEDVRLQMQQTAIDLGDPGYDPVFGYGLVDALATGISNPVTHILVDKLKGSPLISEKSIVLSSDIFDVHIINNSLSRMYVDVYEAGVMRDDLSTTYSFGKKDPQEINFVLDATGTTLDVFFTPKGQESDYADVYIQAQ